MSWLDGVRHRVRALLDAGRYERELDEEMRFHEDLDALQQRDARRARRRFGNRTYYKEETRRMTWLHYFDVLRQDARFAWRSVVRTPAFTLLVVVTLTLGVGVNAATFSFLDRLYFRASNGMVNPEGVHRLWIDYADWDGGNRRASQAMNFPTFRAIARASGDSTRFAAIRMHSGYRLGGTRRGPALNVVFTTAPYFTLLGVTPFLGRFFAPDEHHRGSGAAVVVLSHRVWKQHLNGDSAIVGRTIKLDTDVYTVVGIAQPEFTGHNLDPVHVWMPMASLPTPEWMEGDILDSHRMRIFHAIVRPTLDVDLTSLRHRATAGARLAARTDAFYWDTTQVVTLGSIIEARGPGDPTQEHVISTRLAGVGTIVLLIAIANVVNLLLARAVRRRREIAVRLALGISRARLIRLLMSETMLLALFAAVAAVLGGWWGATLLRSLLLPDMEWTESALHARVIVFTVAIALGSGVVAGVIPALQFSRPRLTLALKEGSREGRQRSRIRDGLVVMQAALSITLLLGAALFVRSFRNVQAIDTGFDVSQVVFGRVTFEPGQSPPDAAIVSGMRDVEARLLSRPGVLAVGRTSMTPTHGMSFYNFYWDADSSESLRYNFPTVNAVSPGFFRAAGIRLLRGRAFSQGPAAASEVVISATLAGMLWPHRDPLGGCVRMQSRDAPCQHVVGVVEDVVRDKIIERPAPQFYLPVETPQSWGDGTTLVVRMRPDAVVPALQEIRNALRESFATAEPVTTTMSEVLDPQYRPWRLGATLFTAFGALALIVALIGIYSTVSYGVSQRTHEFGVRIALGARLRDVLNQVVGEGVRVVAVGIALGIPLSLAAGRLLSALLFGVEPSDPSAILFVCSVLLAVAMAAALIPAWRAARVDPIEALRAD